MSISVQRVRRWVTDFQWVHQGIGVLGGVTFFVGSIFFLYAGALQLAGVVLFIIGSAGMMIGNLGSVIVKYERHELGL
jgi:membrane-bound ClpP family serine protease